MLNHITIMGRLTRDPELRYTKHDKPVTSFSVAVDRDFQDRSSSERQTDFFDIVAWNKTAEFVDKYFHKGDMAAINGRLQTREWFDRDGKKRIAYEIVATAVYFGQNKTDKSSSKPKQENMPDYGDYSGVPSGNSAFVDFEEFEDDLPF